MPNFNKVVLVGHLTRDIETRQAGEHTVGDGGIAVNDNRKKDKTCFIDFTVWNKTADFMVDYSAKGDPVLLEGSLELDQWEDKEGNKRSKHKLNVQNCQLLKKKEESNGAF